MAEENEQGTNFWDRFSPGSGLRRRMDEGSTLGGAALREIGSNLPGVKPISAVYDFLNLRSSAANRPFTIVDPVAGREKYITDREARERQYALQDYNRQRAAFTGGYSPIAERQMEAASEAWNRALGQISAEQGAVSGLAAQSGRDFRNTGTNVNIGAQRAMTGSGTLPSSGVAGLGGVTGVQAADLAAQAGQAANIQGAASQAALQARAGQMGGLNQLIAAQAAASTQQMAADQAAREQQVETLLRREQIETERAARRATEESRGGIDAFKLMVAELTPQWTFDWKSLPKKEKEKLLRERGIGTEEQYILSKTAEAWTLGQMAQG
jgi:hypothetical protein